MTAEATQRLTGASAPTRRERVRAQTLREIQDVARRVLVTSGADGLSLRAVAREVGMTAPGLYRYVPSREALLAAVVADLYDELVAELERARDAVPASPGVVGGQAADSAVDQAAAELAARLLATCRAFRGWAVRHPAEFGLLFGTPIPGSGLEHHTEPADEWAAAAHAAGQRFGQVFAELVAQAYATTHFPVPGEADIDPDLRHQLDLWCAGLPVPLPIGVMQVFLSCWIRLYGAVTMEVFGHLRFALADVAPMFEVVLRECGRELGLDAHYAPPVA